MVLETEGLRPETIEPVCMRGTPLLQLASNAQIRLPKTRECKLDNVFLVNPQCFGYQINVHNSCVCNEEVALTNRHLVDRSYLKFDEIYFEKLFKRHTKNWSIEAERCSY